MSARRYALHSVRPQLSFSYSITARIAETRMRTVIVYPMNIEDMSNAELQTMLDKSQHFMVKFVQNEEKQKKGYVLLVLSYHQLIKSLHIFT